MGHQVITSDFRDWNMSLESHLFIAVLFLSPDYRFRPGRKKIQSYTAAKGQWLPAFGPKGKEGRRDMQSQMGPAVGLCLTWRQQQLILGVLLPLPRPFQTTTYRHPHEHVCNVGARRDSQGLCNSFSLQQMRKLRPRNIMIFSPKFPLQVPGKIKTWGQLPWLPACTFHTPSALHKFSEAYESP